MFVVVITFRFTFTFKLTFTFELTCTPSHCRYNFQQNTLGSKYMVDLIKKFNKIEHFVYVSTAFVNCQIQLPDDVIMDFPEDIDVIINKLL